jgi:hypothetical protein
LWQQILWTAGRPGAIESVPDRRVLRPDGDIVKLAVNHLPDGQTPLQATLIQRLAQRRAEIRDEQWRRVPELRPWVDATRGWSPPTSPPSE